MRKLVVEWRRLSRFPAKMTLIYARALLSIEKTSFSYPSPFWNLKVSSGDDDEGTDGSNHGNVVDDGDSGDADVVNESCDEDNSQNNYNDIRHS